MFQCLPSRAGLYVENSRCAVDFSGSPLTQWKLGRVLCLVVLKLTPLHHNAKVQGREVVLGSSTVEPAFTINLCLFSNSLVRCVDMGKNNRINSYILPDRPMWLFKDDYVYSLRGCHKFFLIFALQHWLVISFLGTKRFTLRRRWWI